MIGEKFGKWVVLSKGGYKHNNQFWLCRCECGTKKEISVQHLKKGKSTQCIVCAGRQLSDAAKQRNIGKYSSAGFRVHWLKEEGEILYGQQRGICPICEKNLPELSKCAWDHDHKTGVRRALIHRGCNVFLGFIERDSTLLMRVIKYCEKHDIKHGV
jgi:hypothetical protein